MSGLMVRTASGATYLLDRTKMTWQRQHPTQPIYDYHDAGTLDAFPEPVAGARMWLAVDGGNSVWTTPVLSVEELA